MNTEIIEKFGNRVRIRVCGICWKDNKILMVNHKSLTPNDFWAPPGGGIETGQSIAQALHQEFEQETGLTIKPGRFLFGCEFIQPPLHAVELFFAVERVGGTLKVGIDPELNPQTQIISNVSFLSTDEIDQLPLEQKHGIFRLCPNAKQLENLHGFYTI